MQDQNTTAGCALSTGVYGSCAACNGAITALLAVAYALNVNSSSGAAQVKGVLSTLGKCSAQSVISALYEISPPPEEH